MPPWVDEAAELSAVVLGLFAALLLLSRRNARWAAGFERRRFAILLSIAAAVVLVEVTGLVLGHESTSVDQQVLVAIHDGVHPPWRGLFDIATWSASSRVIVPAIALLAIALALARHYFEALQLVTTTAVAGFVVYLAKGAFGRARPQLWDTQWYWGSSFPSGHTLTAAAVATALCLCVGRVKPTWRNAFVLMAVTWVALVGVSRLVLGVHWPTDVVAAACAGLLTGAGVNALIALANRTRMLRRTTE
jgi:undecaprenyl-diphosphatase